MVQYFCTIHEQCLSAALNIYNFWQNEWFYFREFGNESTFGSDLEINLNTESVLWTSVQYNIIYDRIIGNKCLSVGEIVIFSLQNSM